MFSNQEFLYPLSLFQDRKEAGKRLGKELEKYEHENPVILGLPRGGVVVAYEVSEMLDVPLDVLISRKIGAPQNKEFGIGAVSEGNTVVLDNNTIRELQIEKDILDKIIEEEKEEVRRRIGLYRANKPIIPVYNRTVILVDDGLATGVTAEAAIESVKKLKPKKIIFAAPVCAYETSKILKEFVNGVVCILTPKDLYAIGAYYRSFPQVTDEEVLNLLKKAREKQEERRL